jgi:hypothetical protein
MGEHERPYKELTGVSAEFPTYPQYERLLSPGWLFGRKVVCVELLCVHVDCLYRCAGQFR